MALRPSPSRAGRLTVAGAALEVITMIGCALREPPARDLAAYDPELRGGGRHETPVVLVHGYRGRRASWALLEQRLHDDGFATVHAVTDDDSADVAALAERLDRICRSAMQAAGASRVHLVGHSLGGVVLRHAVHRLGLAEHVDAAVTIAAPHRGAPVAWLGRVPVAVDLRPGSPVLAALETAARSDHVRWLALWSDRDVVVPPWSARLTAPALQADNVLVPAQGHLSILRAPALLEHVARCLAAVERDRTGRSAAAAAA
jgi:pimeloyl-ACP methyl ester carboxylesterase